MSLLRTYCADRFVLTMLQFFIAALFVISLLGSCWTWVRRRVGAAKSETLRGERATGMLWVAYAVLTLVCALAVQVAECRKGYKVSLIAFDYVVLTYLFLFNSWFRNTLAAFWLEWTGQE